MSGFVIRRTPQARQDLLDIWDYIAERNLPAADRMIDRMEVAGGRLAINPNIGAARDAIATGLRHLVVHPYVILYKVDVDRRTVEIVRVLHGARDLAALFESPP